MDASSRYVIYVRLLNALHAEPTDRESSRNAEIWRADLKTGEAVRVAEGFNERVPISGLIMTKIDGDARGGAALSIHGVLGVPVKFVGVGEHLEDLTAFEPERMAGRILQMGDIVGLVEKAQQTFDVEAGKQLEEKVLGGGQADGEAALAAGDRRLGPGVLGCGHVVFAFLRDGRSGHHQHGSQYEYRLLHPVPPSQGSWFPLPKVPRPKK